MVKDIEAKKSATAGKAAKPDNIAKQTETYVAKIARLKADIARLEELVAANNKFLEGATELSGSRLGEVEHMEEILERYDLAVAERDGLFKVIRERMDAFPDWYPGMDTALKGALDRDPEYKKAISRKLYLDDVIENAPKDMRRVYNNRGEVSDFHKKGAGLKDA